MCLYVRPLVQGDRGSRRVRRRLCRRAAIVEKARETDAEKRAIRIRSATCGQVAFAGNDGDSLHASAASRRTRTTGISARAAKTERRRAVPRRGLRAVESPVRSPNDKQEECNDDHQPT